MSLCCMGQLFSLCDLAGPSGEEYRQHSGPNSARSHQEQSFNRQFTLRQPIHSDAVTALARVRPGVVLSGSSDKSIILSNYETCDVLRKWTGHTAEVTKLSYCDTAGRQFIASGSRDTTVRIWNFTGTEQAQVLEGHQYVVTGVAILEPINHVCSGSRDNSLRLWDIEVGACIRTQQEPRNLVTHVTYSKENGCIAQTSEDRELKLYDAQSLNLTHSFPKKNGIQTYCDISGDGNYCVTCSSGFNGTGCEVTIWDLREKKILRELWGHEQTVNAAVFQEFSDRLFVVSVSTDHTVRLWDSNTGNLQWTEHIPSGASLLSAVAYQNGSVVVGGQHACLYHANVVSNQDKTFLAPNSMQVMA